MRAVTFQAPGEVRVDERPEPEPVAADDAVVRVEASGICGSDLHIYHGRVKIEPGFVIGHEYVGTVDRRRRAASPASASATASSAPTGPPAAAASTAAAPSTTSATRPGSSATAPTLGSLDGTQAEMVLVPSANLTLRKVPDGLSDDAALFAGDVAGTAYHAIHGDGAAQPAARAGRRGRGRRPRPRRPLRGPGREGLGRRRW